MPFRLFHKFPGLPLWSGRGIALDGVEGGPPWRVRCGEFLVLEVRYRLWDVRWPVGAAVRFRELGRGGGLVMEGAGG